MMLRTLLLIALALIVLALMLPSTVVSFFLLDAGVSLATTAMVAAAIFVCMLVLGFSVVAAAIVVGGLVLISVFIALLGTFWPLLLGVVVFYLLLKPRRCPD